MAERRQHNLYLVTGISAVAIIILGGIIALSVTGGGKKNVSKPSVATFAISRALQAEVTGVPAATLVSAAMKASKTAVAPPEDLAPSAPALKLGGKPEILFIGAEYCPYCAAERWAMVMALSKFGTFGPLRGTTSSSTDVYASTPTFSFYHPTYTSKYIAFVPVELETNTGAPLQHLTPAQQVLAQRFDGPPYVSESGAIPFIYMAGKYIVISAQYGASAIAGRPFASAVPYITSGKNSTSKSAEAAAGYLVADICRLTHGQPRPVCSYVTNSLLVKANP